MPQDASWIVNRTTVRFSPKRREPRHLAVFRAVGGALRAADRISPATAGALAGRVFFTPFGARRAPRPYELELARPAQEVTIPTAAGKLRGHRWGDGREPVLLVHGWAGHGLQLGRFAAELARRGRSAVALDMPGHGRSGRGRSSVVAFARAIAGAAAELGPRAAIVAHSLGAAATTVALGREGVRADRVAFLAPLAELGATARRFQLATGLSDRAVAELRRRSAAWLGASWDELEPLRLAPSMRASLLVLHAEDDAEAPPEQGAALARAWPGARLEVLHALGHYWLLRDPAVVDRVCDFVVAGGEAGAPAAAADGPAGPEPAPRRRPAEGERAAGPRAGAVG